MPVLDLSNVAVVKNAGGAARTPGAGLTSYLEASADCKVGFNYSANRSYDAWVCFQVPDIKADDVVNSAVLGVVVRGAFPATYPSPPFPVEPISMQMRVYGSTKIDAAPSAHTTTQVHLFTSVPTTAYAQSDLEAFTPYYLYHLFTADLTDVIMEILASPGGWSPGDYMFLLLKFETYGATYSDDNNIFNFVGSYQTRTPSYYWADPDVEEYHEDEDYPTLSINYTVTPPGPGGEDRSVVHDLDISQEQSWILLRRDIYNTLTITQDIDWAFVYGRSLEHSFDFDPDNFLIQDIGIEPTFHADAENELTIVQTIEVNSVLSRSFEHSLDIAHVMQRGLTLDQSVVSELTWLEDLSYTKSYYRSDEDTLDLDHTPDADKKDWLVQSTMIISQTIDDTRVLQRPEAPVGTISITQDVSFSINTSKTFEHTLGLTQAYSWWLTDAVRWNGDIGSAPTLTQTGSLILEYPVLSPTLTLTLPNPLLGNRQELELTRIMRETMGGNTIVYGDPTWPKIEILRFKFEKVDDTLAQDMRDFLSQTLGEEVKLTDYEGRVWTGIIINPSGQFVDLDDSACYNATEFDFQGELDA